MTDDQLRPATPADAVPPRSATRYETAGGIATITLDRPEQRNALSVDLLNSLGDHLSEAQASDEIRLIVLTNTGPAFCAGADLKGGRSPAVAGEARWTLPEIFGLITDGDRPVIAEIAGHCMGGGVGLAAACDLSLAADDVQFGFTEVRRGVAPAVISVICLAKLRRSDAAELFLTGRKISAAQAAHVGLINGAVPRGDLEAATLALADEIMAGGPRALAAAKQLMLKVPAMERQAAFDWTARLSAELFASEEAAAGMAAFRDKTDPPWVTEGGRRPPSPT
jgi:methylglutaconyl-CoA hydratase